MTTNQPESTESRLARLEEATIAQSRAIATLATKANEHDGNIDVMVANIQQLTENLNSLTEQTTRNINSLAEQAAQDRQQAAIDRQAFSTRMDEFSGRMEQMSARIDGILEYLRDRNGGSNPPN